MTVSTEMHQVSIQIHPNILQDRIPYTLEIPEGHTADTGSTVTANDNPPSYTSTQSLSENSSNTINSLREVKENLALIKIGVGYKRKKNKLSIISNIIHVVFLTVVGISALSLVLVGTSSTYLFESSVHDSCDSSKLEQFTFLNYFNIFIMIINFFSFLTVSFTYCTQRFFNLHKKLREENRAERLKSLITETDTIVSSTIESQYYENTESTNGAVEYTDDSEHINTVDTDETHEQVGSLV